MQKLVRLFHTIKYLKFTQVYFRFFYFVRARIRRVIGFKYSFTKESKSTPLKLIDPCEYYSTYKDGEFIMLNLSKKFDAKIDWNYAGYGKLWTYNLTYFDFLQQDGMSKETGLALIYDFIDQTEGVKDGLEPFPISLRGINWIKFLTRHDIKEQTIDDSLYAQYAILLDNLEYHLLGNHLLENGFSLLFGAYYFQDEKLYAKATEILIIELDEQILDDGAHFELSPMYHQIMLYRLLDCINLIQNNPWKQDGLLKLLENRAARMLGWLNAISYENGTIPLLNDSTNGIAPTTQQLNDYAANLKLNTQHSTLGESGYRKYQNERYECVIDIGNIGSDYIPGHAHADTFNFELSLKIQNSILNTVLEPFVVDMGLSTYEMGKRRDAERSTAAHNTVEVEGKNSSDVWGGFRVAERAKIIELNEDDNCVTATHDGYKKLGVLHTRTWRFEEDKITIEDSLSRECSAVARLHFHPDITEEIILQRIKCKMQNAKLNIYDYALGFNKTQKALVMEIAFTQKLKVEIAL